MMQELSDMDDCYLDSYEIEAPQLFSDIRHEAEEDEKKH